MSPDRSDADAAERPADRPISIEVAGTTLRATDIAGNDVSYELTGWDPLSWSHTIEEPIDVAVTGRVSELRYDLWNVLAVERIDGELRLADHSEPVPDGLLNVGFDEDSRYSIPAGEYLCWCDGEIMTRIRFDGEATIRKRSFGTLSISFPHPTPVTFAFKSSVERPRERLTVAPTTTAIARGLSHLGAALRTMDPGRVHRNFRRYPPLVEVGPETDIPESVRTSGHDTGIELRVPDTLSAIYTAAPAAYFLGATLAPSPGCSPQLRADGIDFSFEIPTDSSFSDGVRKLLRRTFFLELLVDWIEPDDPTVREYTTLRSEGIDLESCVDRPLAERVATYLEYPADPVDEVLPAWPYRMTVEADPSSASVIPHALHDLAAIDTPETADPPAHSRGATGDADDRSPRDQLLATQELHGRVGDVDREAGFVASPGAYENRLAALERETGTISVTVVTGPSIDPDRADRIAAAYTDREECVATIVDALANPTRAELTDTLTAGTDFLHFVGSCTGGLACSDGRLAPDSLSETGAVIVQLDGADSGTLARDLVTAGTVAVVCRDRSEPGRAESIIGTLLLYGQSVATAAQCSRLVRRDSAPSVVGDGSYRFGAKWRPASIQALSERPDGSLSITVVPFSVDPVGTHWRPEYEGKHLMPAPFTLSVEPASFNDYLSTNNQPVVSREAFYLPDEQRQLLYPIV